MYSKLFAKILDSSIWLQPHPTRIVWITLMAAMDEDGYAHFAAVGNLAHRALVTVEEAAVAVAHLEAPDPDSTDPDYEGRRIERVPGGWIVRNAQKYHDLATREHQRNQTRERVKRHRGNAPVTLCNEKVTPSDADADVHTDTKSREPAAFEGFWSAWPQPHRQNKKAAVEQWGKLTADEQAQAVAEVSWRTAHVDEWQRPRDDGRWAIPHPFRYLRDKRFTDARPVRIAPAGAQSPVYDEAMKCQHDPRCPSPDWHALMVTREATQEQ